MAPLPGAVLPQGSLILVTGANGLVGSHVVDQLIKHEYRVRASVRDAQKSGWLAKYFEEKYGQGKIELVEVKDLTNSAALKQALSGKHDEHDDRLLNKADCVADVYTSQDVLDSLQSRQTLPSVLIPRSW